MNIRKSALGIVLAATLIGVAGCGSGDGGTEEVPEPETSSAAPEQTSEAPAEEETSEEAAAEEETSEEAAPEESEEPEAAAEIVITIRGFAYEMPDSVPAGATITVINEDTAPHTVTADDPSVFDAIAAGGETVTFTAPEEAGEYPFVCTYHGNMTGTLVVTDG